jgi:adenosyl cobinamide kinase/adenosyl cobinamide phosphate guanylyltransferase
MRVGRGLTALVGGARSGKSDLAVRLGQSWPGEVSFVATATAGDDDMAARIARHKDERPSTWALAELPVFAAPDVDAIADDHLVIVDCLTLLASNLMFADQSEATIIDHVGQLAARLAARSAPSVVITNEVGLGVHPQTEIGRSYRDLLGRCNRALTDAAETSLFVVAGQVLPLRRLDITW